MYLIVNPVVKTHKTTECWIILYALWQLELQSINQGFAMDHVVFTIGSNHFLMNKFLSFHNLIFVSVSNQHVTKDYRRKYFLLLICELNKKSLVYLNNIYPRDFVTLFKNCCRDYFLLCSTICELNKTNQAIPKKFC